MLGGLYGFLFVPLVVGEPCTWCMWRFTMVPGLVRPNAAEQALLVSRLWERSLLVYARVAANLVQVGKVARCRW